MTTKKPKAPTVVSLAGVAAFAHVHKPDTEGKFADGKFKITLVLDKGDAAVERFVRAIQAQYKAAIKGARKVHDGPVKDGDNKIKQDGEKDDRFLGKWLVVAKSKYMPQLLSADKAALADNVFVYSGDLIKVGFAFNPYTTGGNAGLSLQLRAVQLLEKRNKGTADYSDAFEDESAAFGGGADELDADDGGLDVEDDDL